MKASFSQAGSIVPDRSSSKISNACLIQIIYSRGIVIVTYQSGLNLLYFRLTFLCIVSQIFTIFIIYISSNCLFKFTQININDTSYQLYFKEYRNSKMHNTYSGSLLSHTNPRTRSFLSPGQRIGCRSLSTTDSQSVLNKPKCSELFSPKFHSKLQSIQNKYYKHQQHKQLKLKTHYNPPKKQNNLSKNGRTRQDFQSLAFHKQKQHSAYIQSNQQDNELHVLIRQMKEKIRLLQQQNLMLRQQQVEDVGLIRKQNQVIFELEDLSKQLTNRNNSIREIFHDCKPGNTRNMMKCEDCKTKGHHQNFNEQIVHFMNKFKEQRDNLQSQNSKLKENNRKQQQKIDYQFIRQENLRQQNQSSKALMEILAKKNEQINIIAQMLNSV